MMKKCYLSFPSTALLLMLWLLASCQQQDKAVKPAEGTAKLTYLAEKLEQTDLPEAESKKVLALFNALTFEESEMLIDLRYQQYLKRSDADAERGAQLVAFRHKLNQAAQERKGKSVYQLDYNDSEEILQLVKPRAGKTQSLPGARTASDCFANITPKCTPWKGNSAIYFDANATSDKEIDGTYVGLVTVQCDGVNTYQDDCDYLFKYQYSKIYTAYRWKTPPPVLMMGSTASTKLIDNNPNRIDCGTYTMEVLGGKGRIDLNWWTPQDAAAALKLVVSVDVDTQKCYTGTWGSEKWYYWGKYAPQDDGYWSKIYYDSTGSHPCVCTIPTPRGNYVVR